jgi:choline dehydrogenase-like flavoprotein
VSLLSKLRTNPKLYDGSEAPDLSLTADVCIVGSGAGGAVTAAVLAGAGLDVVIVEEGGYHDASEFTMRELDVMPKLYQEAGQRTTADVGISVLQGRAVGGTTVVNWTTSFRTPEHVVGLWAERHHVGGFKYADLVPNYDAIEARLGIHKVSVESMNANNRKLYDGCKAMGWEADTLRRNVVACLQTGQCGLGCPVNAKRSMLVTMIPDAIDSGARLVHRARIDRLLVAGGRVEAATGTLLDADAKEPTGKTITVKAKRFVLSGGAINTPAVLLRSGLNANGRVGVRTFLHPVIASGAVYDEPIDPWRGAPQSAASHHFADRGADVGVFFETAPSYPALTAAVLPGFGAANRALMESIGKTALHVALAIDGFHDGTPGGTVKLRPSGSPLLDYPLVPALWEAFRFAQKRLAEAAFASGAKRVTTLHEPPLVMTGPKDVAAIDSLPWETGKVGVFTAHQMGGAAMGDDRATSVVRSEDLRHHTIENLYVIDGSVFPTSLGVNPQESIYGLARLMAIRLAAVAKR